MSCFFCQKLHWIEVSMCNNLMDDFIFQIYFPSQMGSSWTPTCRIKNNLRLNPLTLSSWVFGVRIGFTFSSWTSWRPTPTGHQFSSPTFSTSQSSTPKHICEIIFTTTESLYSSTVTKSNNNKTTNKLSTRNSQHLI